MNTPETIYLIPDASEGVLSHVWCDDPAPGLGMDPEDAIEYRRADTLPLLCRLCSQRITGNAGTTDTALAAAEARIAELETAVADAYKAIENDPAVTDTVWFSDTETLCDRLFRALGEDRAAALLEKK